MIEGILKIGETILNEIDTGLIKTKIKPVKQTKGYIAFLHFQNNKIDIDYEEIEESKLNKYNYIGNKKGNKPQTRLITDNLNYLIKDTIHNLLNSIKDCKLKFILDTILKEFYIKINKNKYLLNYSKFSFIKEKEDVTDIKTVVDEIYRYLQSKGVNKKEVILWGVKYNGEVLSMREDYIEHITEEEFPVIKNKKEGKCYLCGKISDDVSYEYTKNLEFKYFITQKVNFASHFTKKNFYKNYQICYECYKKLKVGEQYIMKYYQFNIGRSKAYIIPEFLPVLALDKAIIEAGRKDLERNINSILNYKGYESFNEDLKSYRDYLKEKGEKINYLINILFYQKIQDMFKVNYLIRDIPPTRIEILRKVYNRIIEISERILNEKLNIFLDDIYFILGFNLVKSSGEVDYKVLYELYNSIFSGIPVDYLFLINEYIKALRMIFLNIEKDKIWKLTDITLRQNLFLLFLNQLKILRGGFDMGEKIDFQVIGDDIKKFINEMGYDKQKAVLFLTGYLIGQIGYAQYKSDLKNSPILNKINFQGMSLNRIMVLLNEIFEKLHQYKILYKYGNNNIYSEAKMLFDKEKENWELNEAENVFYILSGFAYHNMQTVKKQDKGGEDGNNKNE